MRFFAFNFYIFIYHISIIIIITFIIKIIETKSKHMRNNVFIYRAFFDFNGVVDELKRIIYNVFFDLKRAIIDYI